MTPREHLLQKKQEICEKEIKPTKSRCDNNYNNEKNIQEITNFVPDARIKKRRTLLC